MKPRQKALGDAMAPAPRRDYNTPGNRRLLRAGEDLNVCNFMVANSDTDGVFDRAFFRGRPEPRSTSETILYWNQEFRRSLGGHMTLVNLKQIVEPVFTGFADTTNPWAFQQPVAHPGRLFLHRLSRLFLRGV